MGKTENADELFGKHCGTGELTPPSGESRYLGDKLVPVATGLVASGNRWDISESDVSIGGWVDRDWSQRIGKLIPLSLSLSLSLSLAQIRSQQSF